MLVSMNVVIGIGTLVAMLSSLILKYIDLYNNPSLGELHRRYFSNK